MLPRALPIPRPTPGTWTLPPYPVPIPCCPDPPHIRPPPPSPKQARASRRYGAEHGAGYGAQYGAGYGAGYGVPVYHYLLQDTAPLSGAVPAARNGVAALSTKRKLDDAAPSAATGVCLCPSALNVRRRMHDRPRGCVVIKEMRVGWGRPGHSGVPNLTPPDCCCAAAPPNGQHAPTMEGTGQPRGPPYKIFTVAEWRPGNSQRYDTKLQAGRYIFSHVLQHQWVSCIFMIFPFVCILFGAGMPNLGERIGFNLSCKKRAPQNDKRGGGPGGSEVGWVGLHPNTPPPLLL